MGANTFGTDSELCVNGTTYRIDRLSALPAEFGVERLPFSLKLLLENLVRHENAVDVTAEDIAAVAAAASTPIGEREIAYSPARILLQDFTGVPCVVDLAAMRDAVEGLGGNAERVNPNIPVDLVIDHSIIVDVANRPDAFAINAQLEFDRNGERYRALKWAQHSLANFRVVPPDTGICHQVNLELLSQVVFRDAEGRAYPDTVVGTDSHTPMVNGLSVLAWGVGGIEAEAAMLGQPISMLVPTVVGLRLDGALPEGATATDLVLTVAQLLRRPRGRRQVRRVLWPRPSGHPRREPGDDRQHVAGIRLDGDDLPDRRADPALPEDDRAARRPHRPRRGVHEGTGALPRPDGRGRLRREALPRPVERRAEPRRSGATPGPGTARQIEDDVR